MVEQTGKLVVFAWHVDVLKKIYWAFEMECVMIHGATDVKKRDKIVERFQTDPDCKVFIGQIKAAGTGITLTAASTCVFVELPWTPGEVTQAEDRLHRIGQTDTVLIQHLVLKGSIDARVAQTVVRKQEIVEQAVDMDINEEDTLMELFN